MSTQVDTLPEAVTETNLEPTVEPTASSTSTSAEAGTSARPGKTGPSTTPVVVGSVVGSIVLALILAFLLVWLRRRKHRRTGHNHTPSEVPFLPPAKQEMQTDPESSDYTLNLPPVLVAGFPSSPQHRYVPPSMSFARSRIQETSTLPRIRPGAPRPLRSASNPPPRVSVRSDNSESLRPTSEATTGTTSDVAQSDDNHSYETHETTSSIEESTPRTTPTQKTSRSGARRSKANPLSHIPMDTLQEMPDQSMSSGGRNSTLRDVNPSLDEQQPLRPTPAPSPAPTLSGNWVSGLTSAFRASVRSVTTDADAVSRTSSSTNLRSAASTGSLFSSNASMFSGSVVASAPATSLDAVGQVARENVRAKGLGRYPSISRTSTATFFTARDDNATINDGKSGVSSAYATAPASSVASTSAGAPPSSVAPRSAAVGISTPFFSAFKPISGGDRARPSRDSARPQMAETSRGVSQADDTRRASKTTPSRALSAHRGLRAHMRDSGALRVVDADSLHGSPRVRTSKLDMSDVRSAEAQLDRLD